MDSHDQAPAVIAVSGAEKNFGAVRALRGVDFSVAPGECVGLVGHNGAGKSTLVNILNGGMVPDTGVVLLSGGKVERYSTGVARDNGVRCVFQELSLCPNLTVAENGRITHPSITGLGWRKRSDAVIKAKLDDIFPGHTITGSRVIDTLSIAERQMVEIATAFSETTIKVSLVILDEPTSSLDSGLAGQLLAYVRRFVAAGGAVVLISHILGEILSAADRVVVMKDGRVVADRRAADFHVESLVGAMGSVIQARAASRPLRDRSGQTAVLSQSARRNGDIALRAYAGEIVGLAGLGGHGQAQTLVALFQAQGGNWVAPRDGKIAFVAGDRHVDGTLPLWSILKNISISLLPDLTRHLWVDDKAEARVGAEWRERIDIRTDDLDRPILSLSGGNQQKALFARALSTRAPIVLMDDPMRGVDIGTKQEVYAILRAEAEKGRTFVWYSTEMDEVCQCDRVYVFREGRIIAELTGADITEERVLAASFVEHVA